MLRLLAVEDDPNHLPWLRSLLESLGPQLPCETIHIASDWKDATRFLEKRAGDIDVVITDLQDKQTKTFEGFHIIRLAKEKAKGVIAVSSFLDDPTHMRDVLRSGSDFYVKKPFKPDWRDWEEYRDELARSAELSMYFALRRLSIEQDEVRHHLPAPGRLRHDLHPDLASEPLDLFSHGHFNEAVRKGAERFEALVRDRSGFSESGKQLMGKAFGVGQEKLKIPGLEPENDDNFQEGFMFLTMGMMAAIRNVFSHGDEERRSPEECFEMLLFLNWLYRGLDSLGEAP